MLNLRMPNVSKSNRKQLTPEEKTEIEEAFDLFDSDRDKLLDRDEFKVALKARLHSYNYMLFVSILSLNTWENVVIILPVNIFEPQVIVSTKVQPTQALGHTITKEKFTKIFKQPQDQLASWDVSHLIAS